MVESFIETNEEIDSSIDIIGNLMEGKEFFFFVVDEIVLNEVVVRKVYASVDDPYLSKFEITPDQKMLEVFPEKFGMQSKSPTSNTTIAEHVMGNNNSKYISTSHISVGIDGSPRFTGRTIYIDINVAKQAGVHVVSTTEIIDALNEYKKIAPNKIKRIDQIIGYVKDIDREILLTNIVPSNAIMTRESYVTAKNLKVFGRVLQGFSIILTAYDLEVATKESIKTESMKPISAEVIRQAGGWGGAVAGVKIGAATGTLVGIETGRGAIITGAIGGIIFGVAGYFGADWIADYIYEN